MTRIRQAQPLFLLLFTALCNSSSPATRLFHFQCRRNHAHPAKKQERWHPTVGSMLSLARPTSERVSRWFSHPSDFNHKDVGMTNPCLHIDLQAQHDVVPVSTSSASAEGDCKWWPACSSPKGWKRLRLSRRVGWGTSCYNAVRDAALEWEWNDKDQVGIVQVFAPTSSLQQQEYQRRDSYGTGYDVVHNMALSDGDIYGPSSESAIKIWSGAGGRRLATYTRVFSSKWLPRIYCVNPVNVVYDLVDQRGPSTTYTSTAYATCKGHWLRGEERLTVAHRDDGEVDVEIVSYSKHGDSLLGKMIWPVVGPLQERFFSSQMKALQHVAEQHSGEDVQEMGTSELIAPVNNELNRRGPKISNSAIRRW